MDIMNIIEDLNINNYSVFFFICYCILNFIVFFKRNVTARKFKDGTLKYYTNLTRNSMGVTFDDVSIMFETKIPFFHHFIRYFSISLISIIVLLNTILVLIKALILQQVYSVFALIILTLGIFSIILIIILSIKNKYDEKKAEENRKVFSKIAKGLSNINHKKYYI